MYSFLDSIQPFMKIIPDNRPNKLKDKIIPKCSVLYFPIQLLLQSRSGPDEVEDNVKEVNELVYPSNASKLHTSSSLKKSEMPESLVQSHPHSTVVPSECMRTDILVNVDQMEVEPAPRLSSLLHQETDKVLHLVWPHRW